MDPISLPLYSAKDLFLPRRDEERKREMRRKERKRTEAVTETVGVKRNVVEWWLE